MKLRGTFTALVTPFNADGSVDFGALDALVDYQLAGNISGLVPCGTTGEAVTLTESERFAVIAAVAKKAEGRPVIAGTGTNNTAQSVELHKKAAAHGATHSLAVTPYYNKPTASGLIAHYTAMAEAAPLPVVLYNVPARTGCDMSLDVVCKLAEHPNIVAVKEATGLMDRVTRLRARVPRDFAILSGDDPTAALLGLLGGDGSVSVTSNYAPAETTELVAAAIDGNV
ncbi:MAG: 4-hydroxy-tetrahydrodipicolinate synthase, partial [Myxococcota bacterium]